MVINVGDSVHNLCTSLLSKSCCWDLYLELQILYNKYSQLCLLPKCDRNSYMPTCIFRCKADVNVRGPAFSSIVGDWVNVNPGSDMTP